MCDSFLVLDLEQQQCVSGAVREASPFVSIQLPSKFLERPEIPLDDSRRKEGFACSPFHLRNRPHETAKVAPRYTASPLGIEPDYWGSADTTASSTRCFVFRYFSIRSIASITSVGSEYSFMMKINDARCHTHRLRAE